LESSVFNDGSRLFSFGRQEVSIMRSLLRTFFPGLVCSLFILSSVAAVNASLRGGGFGAFSGVLLAAPQAPDARTILRQKLPIADVPKELKVLKTSGVNLTDTSNGISIPSINTNLQPTCIVSVPATSWKAEYFTDRLAMVRSEGTGFISWDWGDSSPHSGCVMRVDNFLARWTRTVNFAQGIYRFTVNAVDGSAALAVDGQPKLTVVSSQGMIDVFLPAGNHVVKMDYNHTIGPAKISFSWADVTNCFANVPAERWRGEYFNNTNLTGSPLMVRDDGDGFLNFNFGDGSPNSSCTMPVDNFSARFTRTVNFAPGLHRFSVTTDDGARLYVDGQLVIDRWFDQGATTYTTDLVLTSGNHEVKLEYYERSAGALIQLSWTNLCIANVNADRWRGEYYNNTTLTAPALMVRDDGDGFLNLNFGEASPSSVCGLGADNFSARWTRTVNFAAGSYRFIVTVDDGARIYIDGLKIIDAWVIQAPTTYTADATLSAGPHEVKLEYFESGGGASVKLFWGDVNCLADVPANRWRGEYYNGATLGDFPAMIRDDGATFLNFDFGLGSPSAACGIGVDNFSARWTRTVNFAATTYRFSVTGDDGVRLYVDGQTKIDKWFSQGATTYTADVALSAGAHEVKLEYFESGGPGVAFLSWADATGVNCLPNSPLPLISVVPQTGGRENIASTAPETAPKRCGKKSSD
jgi:hypothetical protein